MHESDLHRYPRERGADYAVSALLRYDNSTSRDSKRSGREQSLLPFRFARIQKRLAFLRRFVLDFVHFPAAPLWTRFTDTVFPRWIVGYRLGWLPPCFVPSVIRNRNLHQSRRADGLPFNWITVAFFFSILSRGRAKSF